MNEEVAHGDDARGSMLLEIEQVTLVASQQESRIAGLRHGCHKDRRIRHEQAPARLAVGGAPDRGGRSRTAWLNPENQLLWDGKRVEVRQALTLTRVQKVLAVIVSICAILTGLNNASVFLRAGEGTAVLPAVATSGYSYVTRLDETQV